MCQPLLSLLALGSAYSLQTFTARLSSEWALDLPRGTAIVVWGREQDPVTPVEDLEHEYSRDGDTAADSPALSIRAALSISEMPFQSWLGRTNPLPQQPAAGMLQLRLYAND